MSGLNCNWNNVWPKLELKQCLTCQLYDKNNFACSFFTQLSFKCNNSSCKGWWNRDRESLEDSALQSSLAYCSCQGLCLRNVSSGRSGRWGGKEELPSKMTRGSSFLSEVIKTVLEPLRVCIPKRSTAVPFSVLRRKYDRKYLTINFIINIIYIRSYHLYCY